MPFDPEIMKQLVAHSSSIMVLKEHGQPGIDALKVLLEAIKKIYNYVEPELYSGHIVLFQIFNHYEPCLITSTRSYKHY